MPKCKQCSTKYSMWFECGDGLCKSCHEKADAETAREEAKRKVPLLSATKTTINSVVTALIGDEQPLCVVFLHADIQEKTSGMLKKVAGMVGGIVIGGAVGEIVFGGSLLSKEATYSGELDILVVTARRIYIGRCKDTPFMSEHAWITPEHLQLLQTTCKAGTTERLAWEIAQTQVSPTATGLIITHGDTRLSRSTSELYMNDTDIYHTTSPLEVCRQIGRLTGSMPRGEMLAGTPRCFCCDKPLAGALVPGEEFLKCRLLTAEDRLGHVCCICGAVSCVDCKKQAVGFGWWSGYDNARCAQCGNTNPTLKIVVPQEHVVVENGQVP